MRLGCICDCGVGLLEANAFEYDIAPLCVVFFLAYEGLWRRMPTPQSQISISRIHISTIGAGPLAWRWVLCLGCGYGRIETKRGVAAHTP